MYSFLMGSSLNTASLNSSSSVFIDNDITGHEWRGEKKTDDIFVSTDVSTLFLCILHDRGKWNEESTPVIFSTLF